MATSAPPEVEERQVQVRFTTKLPAQFRFDSAPFAVPARLTRYGLSEVVNTLLNSDPHQPFDFLVEGELLQTSLEKHLLAKNISAETIVSLEYRLAVRQPEPKASTSHDDWVAAVNGRVKGFALSGCYDGFGRLWTEDGRCVAVFSGHTSAVMAIAPVPGGGGKQGASCQAVITGSKDRTLRLFKMEPSLMSSAAKTETVVHATCVMRGHTDAVESVALSPDALMVCSGSWDQSIRLWKTENGEDDAPSAPPTAEKKRKVGGKAVNVPAPVEAAAINTLSGHTQCVSSVDWPATGGQGTIVSGSWDHSVRRWDVATGINTETLSGSKAIYCVHVGGERLALVALGGADSVLRLWDSRVKGTATETMRFKSHQGWISDVKWYVVKTEREMEHEVVGLWTVDLWDDPAGGR
eukprot:jgi/Mesvir1/10661/Mv13750-RA.2